MLAVSGRSNIWYVAPGAFSEGANATYAVMTAGDHIGCHDGLQAPRSLAVAFHRAGHTQHGARHGWSGSFAAQQPLQHAPTAGPAHAMDARDQGTGCLTEGPPLAWPGGCATFNVNMGVDQSAPYELVEKIATRAFERWQNADCGSGRRPSIEVTNLGPVECGEIQYNTRGGNANIVVFRHDDWMQQGVFPAAAATRVLFDDDGRILDADVEVNATSQVAVLGPSGPISVRDFDLETILVHEFGHFLGLDHARDRAAVMFAELPPGVGHTDLEPDDVMAVCAAYPPDGDRQACEPLPAGALRSTCAPATPLPGIVGGCSVSTQPTRDVGLFGWASCGALFWGWRRVSCAPSRPSRGGLRAVRRPFP